jgi:NADH-quinone oxidoreductase subunit G
MRPHSVGYLTEAANTVGAYPLMHSQARLECQAGFTAPKAVILLNNEPEFDSAPGVQLPLLNSSQMVALSPFNNMSFSDDVADFSTVPLSTLVVVLEFSCSGQANGKRVLHKVLRVLG